MGFFKTTKKVTGHFFNFRIGQWIDYESLKWNASYLVRCIKSLYQIKPVNQTESFEEAMQRLGMSERDIYIQYLRYRLMMKLYIFTAIALLTYTVYIFKKGNFMGTVMSSAITLYALSLVFVYHFWAYQLKKQKLGCTLREWLYDLFHKDKTT